MEIPPQVERLSEADALAKVNGDTTLTSNALKELEVLKAKKIEEITEAEFKRTLLYLKTEIKALNNNEKGKEELMREKYDETKQAIVEKMKKPITEIKLNYTSCIRTSKESKVYYENFLLRSRNKELLYHLTSAKEQEYEANLEIAKSSIVLYEEILSHLEAYENLQLKDTPTVQNLTKESLKTATQKVDGFMKWGYAKAEELKDIGGDELVQHANASKIALGVGALVAGLGTGAVAYTLLNHQKPPPHPPQIPLQSVHSVKSLCGMPRGASPTEAENPHPNPFPNGD